MLYEDYLHQQYIQYLKTKKIKFEHEARTLNGVIDFKLELNEKTVGVEVKADRSNVFSAIGQLLNFRRTFSNVYLLSTEKFYQIIREILNESGLQDTFGFILFKDNTFITLSEPKIKDYYFHEKHYKPPKPSKTKTLVLDKGIVDFLEKHKNKPFICSDMAKELKINMPLAQSRTINWRRFGLIAEIPQDGHPKQFKVLKTPKGEHVYL